MSGFDRRSCLASALLLLTASARAAESACALAVVAVVGPKTLTWSEFKAGAKAGADRTVGVAWRTLFGPVELMRRAYPASDSSSSSVAKALLMPFRVSLGWRETPHDLLYKYVMPVLRTATPLRFGRANRLVYGNVGVLFEQVFRNPEWIFDPALNPKASVKDWEIIQKYGLAAELEEFRASMREYHKSYRAHRYVRTATDLLVLGTTTSALVHAAELEANARSLEDYRAIPLREGEIQILSETVPFPHLALRMGSEVYSYGVEHFSKSSVSEYLSPKSAPPGEAKEAGERNSSARALGSFLSGAYKATGWGEQPRSVQVASIYLKPDEYLRLKRSLEMKVGNYYDNTTFVNDCATMIDRAIGAATNGEVNFSFLVDASPGQMVLAVDFFRRFYPDRFGEPALVMVERPDRKAYHVWRNALINSLEAKLFATNFVFDKTWRLVEEVKHFDKDWESMDPVVVEARDEQARKIALDRIREDLSLALVTLNLDVAEVSLNDLNSIAARIDREKDELREERASAETNANLSAATLLSFGFRESLLKEIEERVATYRKAKDAS